MMRKPSPVDSLVEVSRKALQKLTCLLTYTDIVAPLSHKDLREIKSLVAEPSAELERWA